jgi:hypothetical protein
MNKGIAFVAKKIPDCSFEIVPDHGTCFSLFDPIGNKNIRIPRPAIVAIGTED